VGSDGREVVVYHENLSPLGLRNAIRASVGLEGHHPLSPQPIRHTG
jgi:hypothetical protein